MGEAGVPTGQGWRRDSLVVSSDAQIATTWYLAAGHYSGQISKGELSEFAKAKTLCTVSKNTGKS